MLVEAVVRWNGPALYDFKNRQIIDKRGKTRRYPPRSHGRAMKYFPTHGISAGAQLQRVFHCRTGA
jgi:hypothetical protein